MGEFLYDSQTIIKVRASLPECHRRTNQLLLQVEQRWLAILAEYEHNKQFNIVESMENLIEELTDWAISQNWLIPDEDEKREHKNLEVQRLFEKSYGVLYYEEIEVTRNAVAGYIQDLSLPQSLRHSLIDTIFRIPFRIIGDQSSWKASLLKDRYITLSPSLDSFECKGIKLAFRQSVTPELIRAVIRRHAGHELGHEIDFFFYQKLGNEVSAEFGLEFMDDFPIIFDATDGDRVIARSARQAMSERFAEHFGHAAVLETGLPQNIIIDQSRKNLGPFFGLKIHPTDVISICYELLTSLHKSDSIQSELPACYLEDYLTTYLMPNKELALAYPFQRQAVEAMLKGAYDLSQSLEFSPVLMQVINSNL